MPIQSLGRQPLFQLLGAIIVLLVTDWQPLYGLAAAAVWIVWIAWSASSIPSSTLFAVPK